MTTGAAGSDRPAPGSVTARAAEPVTEPVTEPPSWATPAGPMVTVRLLGLPVPLMARAQEHSADLTRELTLIGESMRQRGDHAGLPVRLVLLVEQLSAPYSGFTVAQEQQLAEALRDGAASVDLTYQVPSSVTAAAAALGEVLDEADAYCREGQHLLTLATPDHLVAYRHWFLEQFIVQGAGGAAVSWPDYAVRHRVQP